MSKKAKTSTEPTEVKPAVVEGKPAQAEATAEVKPLGLSGAVREILAKTPEATVKDVVAALKADYPDIKASYRPVFGAVRRIKNKKD